MRKKWWKDTREFVMPASNFWGYGIICMQLGLIIGVLIGWLLT